MEKSTKIIGGVMSAVIFASVFVGSTLALYTSTRTVNNHIVSGGMRVKFYLNYAAYDVLADDGSFDPQNPTRHVVNLESEHEGRANYVENKGIDLGKYAGDALTQEKIVPTLSGGGVFLVENEGDVAFDLTARIINVKAYTYSEEQNDWVEDANASILKDEQIVYTISSTDGSIKAETTKNEAAQIALGQINKSGSTASSIKFNVDYKFKDLDGATFDEVEVGDKNRNNRAMNQKVTFDVQIECVQAVRNA